MVVKKKFITTGRAPALGRGLDALISTDAVRTEGSSTINEIAIGEIEPNPNQPRREFGEASLAELADSIRQIGIVQPITLHQLSPDRYMIIAGERRWRAAQIAGLKSIPAYIRTLSDAGLMEMALVENIQREDLNVIEVALAYQKLLEQENMTQEKIARRVGKSRTLVTNTLRLLRLPAEVQLALQKREIDAGHARALLAIESPSEQVRVFRDIVANGYSVRQVERIAARLKSGVKEKAGRGKNSSANLSEKYVSARDNIHRLLGAKVQIACARNGRGKIMIAFDSEASFDNIVAALGKIHD
ncbi:MAG: ParB/RepB/Spo0J family partition protein [Prevotella sp.]|nr:ParB/RepB/Spo0J family partition protein [Prevotella sp.]